MVVGGLNNDKYVLEDVELIDVNKDKDGNFCKRKISPIYDKVSTSYRALPTSYSKQFSRMEKLSSYGDMLEHMPKVLPEFVEDRIKMEQLLALAMNTMQKKTIGKKCQI